MHRPSPAKEQGNAYNDYNYVSDERRSDKKRSNSSDRFRRRVAFYSKVSGCYRLGHRILLLRLKYECVRDLCLEVIRIPRFFAYRQIDNLYEVISESNEPPSSGSRTTLQVFWWRIDFTACINLLKSRLINETCARTSASIAERSTSTSMLNERCSDTLLVSKSILCCDFGDEAASRRPTSVHRFMSRARRVSDPCSAGGISFR